jgi:hypothetical protein
MGSKKSPDPGPMAEAYERASQMQMQLGYDQLAWDREQFNITRPFMENIANHQMELGLRAATTADAAVAAGLRQAELQSQAMMQAASIQAGALNNASQLQYELGMRGLEQNAEYMQMSREGMERTLAMQEETAAQGREYHQHWQENFKDIETRIASDAMRYSSDEEYERQAGIAAADVANRAAVERAANERAMASMGVDPNSGRALAIQNQSGLQNAALGAGAMNSARSQAELRGQAMLMDAAGLGRGMTGASLGAYGLASQNANNAAQTAMQGGVGSLNAGANAAGGMGDLALRTLLGAGSNAAGLMSAGSGLYNNAVGAMNSAGGNYLTPYNNYGSGMRQSHGMIGQGLMTGAQGAQSVFNGQMQAYQARQQALGGFMQGLGTFAGMRWGRT